MTGDKWMTSGASRLKSRMNRKFERRAAFGRHLSSPSPRTLLKPHELSSTTKKHPSCIRRNNKGLTGTYSKWADPIYRRAITPSSPVREPSNACSDYLPGTILPRRLRNVKPSSWHEIPTFINQNQCISYRDQVYPSDHQQSLNRRYIFNDVYRDVAHRSEMNSAASPIHQLQRNDICSAEVSNFCGNLVPEDRSALCNDTQFANQGEWGYQREIFHHHYVPCQQSDFGAELSTISRIQEAFPSQYSQFSRANSQPTEHRASCSGIPRFQKLDQGMPSQRSSGFTFNDKNRGPIGLEWQTPPENYRVPDHFFPISSCEIAQGRGLKINNDGSFDCESREKGLMIHRRKFLEPVADFGEDVHMGTITYSLPKGIDRFRSKRQLEENIENEAALLDGEDNKDMTSSSTNEVKVVSRRSVERPPLNSLCSIQSVETQEDNKKLQSENESYKKENKRIRLQDDFCDQKENELPAKCDTFRFIGSTLGVQFFNGDVEVDIRGHSVSSKPPYKFSDAKHPHSSPNTLESETWNNKVSLWG